jgi:aminoglycoside 3-N-acetyltransferase I
MFDVRLLTANDTDLLRQMLDAFADAFEDPDSYQGAQPRASYLERLLGSDTFIALAAVRDGTVIGALAAYELHKFEQERSEIYIYDLAVVESAGGGNGVDRAPA